MLLRQYKMQVQSMSGTAGFDCCKLFMNCHSLFSSKAFLAAEKCASACNFPSLEC